MKRIVTIATAALFLAAMTSPSLAHKTKRKHSHKKPVATQPVEHTKAGQAKEPQPPVESLTQKPTTPAPAPVETQPAPAPSQPRLTNQMTEKAPHMAKDKATGMVKEKATGAVMDAATPAGTSAPSMPVSNPPSAVKPLTNPVPGMPK